MSLIASGCSTPPPPSSAAPVVNAMDRETVVLLRCIAERDFDCIVAQGRTLRALVLSAQQELDQNSITDI